MDSLVSYDVAVLFEPLPRSRIKFAILPRSASMGCVLNRVHCLCPNVTTILTFILTISLVSLFHHPSLQLISSHYSLILICILSLF